MLRVVANIIDPQPSWGAIFAMRRPVFPSVIWMLGLSVVLASSSRADDPCAAFTWNVRPERTLFGEEAQLVVAGQRVTASPTLATDRLYQLQLKAQSDVTFVAPPGKKSLGEGTYAGLAKLTVDTAAVYRIALDQAIWVDVMANASLLPARDFQGRSGCSAPHKIVEFVLPARTSITIQLSGGRAPSVKVTVTRPPPAA